MIPGSRSTPCWWHWPQTIDQAQNWVRGNYPEWLDDVLKARFGDDTVREMRAHKTRAPIELRVDHWRVVREWVAEKLASESFTLEAGCDAPEFRPRTPRRPTSG